MSSKAKRILISLLVTLLLVSMFCFLFAFARYASAPAGIHNFELLFKLSEDDQVFVHSVMRSQLLQVSGVLGGLVMLWAGFAVVVFFLWSRASRKAFQ
jgi:hypothetical protein